ncbi:hypothetical protein E2C01_011867 [Portunus trituberculatus]|uniref:Uncharacterized protein n=1 Tax=Portunus trituberculatus TaxID=210409 RepID=A0A5B7DCM1_PORTR|nr:hypothetical protein [Portunus trituberculatus]
MPLSPQHRQRRGEATPGMLSEGVAGGSYYRVITCRFMARCLLAAGVRMSVCLSICLCMLISMLPLDGMVVLVASLFTCLVSCVYPSCLCFLCAERSSEGVAAAERGAGGNKGRHEERKGDEKT